MTQGPSQPLLPLPPEGLDSGASFSQHTVGGRFGPPPNSEDPAPGRLPGDGEQQGEETAVLLEVWGLKPQDTVLGTFFEVLLAFEEF